MTHQTHPERGSHSAPDPNQVSGTVYDGLLDHAEEADHWAFGTGFTDPLAGVDSTVPEGVDPGTLAAYCLMLGDDALVWGHRLSEWCSNAPDLEDDVAVANVALDLLGQARLLLARAAAADPSVVPPLPDGSPVPPEDALTYFRDDRAFRNVRLAEAPNGDFADLVVRMLLFVTARLAAFERLVDSRDPVLAAVAAKGVLELAYHRDYAGRWFVVLAGGTEESARRLDAAVRRNWPMLAELLASHPAIAAAADQGVGVDPRNTADEVTEVLGRVWGAAGLALPEPAALVPVAGRTGRDGVHSEALSHLVGEMQVVARAHPMGRW